MKFDPNKYYRRSLRLKGYDYSQVGAYFVTVCTYGREYLFGEIIGGKMCLNEIGKIVLEEWERTSLIRDKITLDEFVIMPNHIHGIIINDWSNDMTIRPKGAHGCAPLRRQPRSLGSFIAGFKSATTKRINELRKSSGAPVWQRNYYEHVIRNDDDLHCTRTYIINNPLKWEMDRENAFSSNSRYGVPYLIE